MTNTTQQKGFTLIELMIVVAIIGILAAIAIPQFSSYRVKAFNSAAESDLRNIMTSEEATYADSQSYVPASTTAQTTLTGLTGAKISKNVVIKIVGDANGTDYTAYTTHGKGNKEYAGSATGVMRYKDGASGTITGTALLTSSSTWGTGSL